MGAARAKWLPQTYLAYRVLGRPSRVYKLKYVPHERFELRVEKPLPRISKDRKESRIYQWLQSPPRKRAQADAPR